MLSNPLQIRSALIGHRVPKPSSLNFVRGKSVLNQSYRIPRVFKMPVCTEPAELNRILEGVAVSRDEHLVGLSGNPRALSLASGYHTLKNHWNNHLQLVRYSAETRFVETNFESCCGLISHTVCTIHSANHQLFVKHPLCPM